MICIRCGQAEAAIPFSTRRTDAQAVVSELRREIRLLIQSDKELKTRRGKTRSQLPD